MSILDQILAVKLGEIERLRPRGAELRGLATGQAPARPFAAALGAGNNVALIAEFKRRSPSAGWIRENALVAETITAYNDSGARAISVLTDARFFGGSLHDLQTAHEKTSVPILRKDFLINELQLFEARAAGADAVLLIVSALDQAALRDLLACAREIGLGVLVEAHHEAEVERALEVGSDVIGINNRNLATFDVDHDLARRISSAVPDGVILVAESGITSAEDVARFGDAGVHAVLVGEALMRSADIHAAVRAFSSQRRLSRV